MVRRKPRSGKLPVRSIENIALFDVRHVLGTMPAMSLYALAVFVMLSWSAVAQSALPKPDRCISDADIKTLTADIDAFRRAGADVNADVQLVLDRHISGCSFDEAIEKLNLAGFITGEYPDVSQSLRKKGYVRTGNAHLETGWFLPLSVVVDLFGRDDGSFDVKGRFLSDGP